MEARHGCEEIQVARESLPQVSPNEYELCRLWEKIIVMRAKVDEVEAELRRLHDCLQVAKKSSNNLEASKVQEKVSRLKVALKEQYHRTEVFGGIDSGFTPLSSAERVSRKL
ncbi:hypothetical protein ACLOJK_013422 [Asimina triloba]